MMITDNGPMTAEQAVTLKRLAKDAYELDAYKPNLTRAEADRRLRLTPKKLGDDRRPVGVTILFHLLLLARFRLEVGV